MKWWLISQEDMATIRTGLEADTHKPNDYNCEDWPPGSGCDGCKGDTLRAQALYILDTVLHRTGMVPSDYSGN